DVLLGARSAHREDLPRLDRQREIAPRQMAVLAPVGSGDPADLAALPGSRGVHPFLRREGGPIVAKARGGVKAGRAPQKRKGVTASPLACQCWKGKPSVSPSSSSSLSCWRLSSSSEWPLTSLRFGQTMLHRGGTGTITIEDRNLFPDLYSIEGIDCQ